MKSIYDLSLLGYTVHDRIPLRHGRSADWEVDVPGMAGDRYLPSEAGVLHDLRNKKVERGEAEVARQSIQDGKVMFLTADDFAQAPPLVDYRVERAAQPRHGGPGGYPYYPESTVVTGTRSLDSLAQQVTGHPMATWAIRPQVGSWPDCPELYFLVPTGEAGKFTAAEAMAMLDGRRVEGERKDIQVADHEVLIGSIKLDRKTYLIRFSLPQE